MRGVIFSGPSIVAHGGGGVIKSCTFPIFLFVVPSGVYLFFLFWNITNDNHAVVSIFRRASLYTKEVFFLFFIAALKSTQGFFARSGRASALIFLLLITALSSLPFTGVNFYCVMAPALTLR